MLDEKNMVYCKCCGNRDSSYIIERDGGYVCKLCNVWYKHGETRKEIMEQVVCENGYAQLRRYDFDAALDTFKNAVLDYPESISALWGLLQARFGVVYVKGFFKDVSEPVYCFPNYHKLKKRYVQTEPEYEKIMSLLKDDAELRFSYEEKAAKIDDALDNFKKLIGSADNDVFICVKISAATEADPARNGTTEDYKFALKVYDDLKKRGIKVFFSYVTLKNDVKSDEKIWSYLVKSKKMLLIGSSSEYLESAWVQSEWKRWLHLKREDELYICTLNGPEESWLDILPQEIAALEPQIYTRSTYEKMLDDICANTEISHKEDDVKIAEESPKQDGRIVYKDGSFEVLKYGIMEVHIPYSHDEPEYTRYNRMTEVYIPNSVKIVSKQAFSGATGIKKVVLSSNTEVIGNDAFNGCRVLQEISLPPTLESIGERAFANCKDMKKLHIRGKLIKIENLAFANCERLSEVIFDEGINVESEHFTSCFQGCKNLTDITVPEGIETIERFYECPRLRTVRLPKSTRKIASFAFNNNSIDKVCAITDIYYSGTKEEWKNIEIGKYNNKLTGIFGRIKIHYNS